MLREKIAIKLSISVVTQLHLYINIKPVSITPSGRSISVELLNLTLV